MSQITLALKYRPKQFDDLCEQQYIKVILENQIKNNDVKNVYLFTGPAGTGKTTSARIFANMINDSKGLPIEVDAASNNGVDDVRRIIEEAKFKAIDSKYKVYILDEVHQFSQGAWNAMLKLLEEPPKTTIFILCTTNPERIPKTILSRCQRYDFQKISFDGIVNRLNYICLQEHITVEIEALKFIAKVSDGGMRDAISMLDKCISLTKDLTVSNVVQVLGISDYSNLNMLLHNILDNNYKEVLNNIENVYNQGKDLKLFVKQFVQYILDVCKYKLFQSYDYVQIPNTIDLNEFNDNDYINLLNILDDVINLLNNIKYDSNPKVLIESTLLLINGRSKYNET